MPIPKKEKENTDLNKDEKSSAKTTENDRKSTNTESEKKAEKSNKTDNNKEEVDKDIYDFNDENWRDEDALNTEEIENTNKTGKVSLGIYRKIALSFIIATFILFGFIIYLYLVKVTIHITPDTEKINTNIIIDVKDTEKFETLEDEKSIFGVVKEFEVTHSKEFETTGKKVINDEILGEVEIFNKYNKNQPLVATTRLLTPDNKLFRIKNTVNVPAGKSAIVEIYTDNPSKEMAIESTTLSIPGLWSGLQDKIYAVNNKPFVFQENAKHFVLKSDILDARESLKAEIIEKANNEVGAMYSNFDKFIYKINEDSLEEVIDVEALDEADKFTLEMKTKVSVVAFNNSPIEDLASVKIENELEANEQLISIDSNSLEHNLDNYSVEDGIASINSFISGSIGHNAGGSLFEKEKILGLTKKQLEEYLGGLPSIKNYTISFEPSFIERVPNVIDRINIVVSE